MLHKQQVPQLTNKPAPWNCCDGTSLLRSISYQKNCGVLDFLIKMSVLQSVAFDCFTNCLIVKLTFHIHRSMQLRKVFLTSLRRIQAQSIGLTGNRIRSVRAKLENFVTRRQRVNFFYNSVIGLNPIRVQPVKFRRIQKLIVLN